MASALAASVPLAAPRARGGNAARRTAVPAASASASRSLASSLSSFSSALPAFSAARGAVSASRAARFVTRASADAPPAAAKPAKGPSKARLPSLDALRFFLIAYIAIGHFVIFATSNPVLIKLMAQVNVWVGGFFVISGYVAGYTATELDKYEASPRVRPPTQFVVSRVAGYYPLYFLVQLLFGAMFIWADNFYNGPVQTAIHALLTLTLTQAWFPAHAEVWNAPTWFLSALTFATMALPFALPVIAGLKKRGLQIAMVVLTAVSLVAKFAYSYDLGGWAFFEGTMAAKAHPNMLLWNVTRFHPFYALVEVLMGVVAVRMVMTETLDEEGKPTLPRSPAGSALLPLLGIIGVTVGRAFGWIQLNDPLTRGLVFIPLFILLLIRLHKQTLANQAAPAGVTGILSHPALSFLGAISFPIFIVHGALGQLFFKKVVATKVWGGVLGPQFFPVWVLTVLVSAALLHQFFVTNKKVGEISDKVAKKIIGLIQ